VYVTPSSAYQGLYHLHQISNTTIRGDPNFFGTVQIAKLPQGSGDADYDLCAGAYPISCNLSAFVNGDGAQYTFSWTKGGLSRPLLM
jgi:endoglucanase Acf2